MPFQTGGAGVTTLSDLQIDVDKDWKAHGIYNLGDLTPKVDGAYNIGTSGTEFDTIYANAGPPPGADSIGKEELKEPAVDSAYIFDDAVTSAKVDPSVDLEFVRSNDNVIAGDIDVKVDGAYNLGSPTAKFDTAYATNFPGAPLITEPVSNAAYNLNSARDVNSGAFALNNLLASPDAADVVYQAEMTAGTAASMFDSDNLTVSRAADIAYQTELQPVKAASIFDHTNLGVARAADITYQTELQPVKAASIFDHTNLGVARAADIAYQTELQPVKAASIVYHTNLSATRFGDIFDSSYLKSGKAKDIVYHGNFNLPSAEARNKVVESTYGMAADQTGVKGLSKQVTQKRDFAFRTETPNHAYWHRMYNTPAAFETVYQDYTTSMQKKGTTPSKSAPGTADPNPQPGAMWSVSMIPDGTWVRNWATPTGRPRGLTWDGTYLWHSENTADYIYQLDPSDGSQTGGFPSLGPTPRGLAWDGEYLWSVSDTAGYIYQTTTGGSKVGGFVSLGPDPYGLVWDGTYLWNTDYTANYIYQMNTDGTKAGGFASPGPDPYGLAWDGTYLWNVDGSANYIYQLDTAGNTKGGGFFPPGGGPQEPAWEGAYLWHADGGSDYMYQLGNAGNFDVNYRIFAK